MTWFKNLNIWGKLIVGFSIMFIIMLSIGLTGYGSSRQINENLNEVFGVNLPSLNYLVQADRDLQQLLVAERTMIYTDVKSEDFKKLVQDYEENLAQSRARLEKYRALPASTAEKDLAAEFEKARTAWEELSRKVVEARKEDTRAGRRLALELSRGEASVKFETMRGFLDKLQEITLKNAEKITSPGGKHLWLCLAGHLYRFGRWTAHRLLPGLFDHTVHCPSGPWSGGIRRQDQPWGPDRPFAHGQGRELFQGDELRPSGLFLPRPGGPLLGGSRLLRLNAILSPRPWKARAVKTALRLKRAGSTKSMKWGPVSMPWPMS